MRLRRDKGIDKERTRNQPAGAWWAPQAENIPIAVSTAHSIGYPGYKTSHGRMLGSLPTFCGCRKQFPWISASRPASGYRWLSSSGTRPTWWGCPQEGVCPLLGTTIPVVTTQKASTATCASRQTIPWHHFSAILTKS